MKVYVLSGGYYYEMSYSLGVYASREKAEEARDSFIFTGEMSFDYYNIHETILDAVAKMQK